MVKSRFGIRVNEMRKAKKTETETSALTLIIPNKNLGEKINMFHKLIAHTLIAASKAMSS
ncbi:hypothetical protein A141_17680 [Vibrio crassostreae ZF-91]|nr:hypothetical protein A141_17680 [Vibrio crassostreae ZF-91]